MEFYGGDVIPRNAIQCRGFSTFAPFNYIQGVLIRGIDNDICKCFDYCSPSGKFAPCRIDRYRNAMYSCTYVPRTSQWWHTLEK